MSLLSFWEFWLTDRKSARRLRNGRIQSPELFLFVEIQKWACYPGGSSCFPCSSATWQGPDPRFPTLSPLLAGPLPLSVTLLKQSIPQPPPAGKRAQPAVETDWLRRRPGRCTEDKFVFVSWAVTLSSRTLTRSCQREGRREPGTAATLPHSCGLILRPALLPPSLSRPRGEEGSPVEPALSSTAAPWGSLTPPPTPQSLSGSADTQWWAASFPLSLPD